MFVQTKLTRAKFDRSDMIVDHYIKAIMIEGGVHAYLPQNLASQN